jgi:quercetin dioxygenase-like cupin family protein
MAPTRTGKSLILHPPTDGEGSMKHIFCSLLVAILPFGSVLADEAKFKNAKVTLVYEHALPNVPGKSLRAVLVEYGPGGGSPSHRHPSSAFIYARVLEGAIRSKVNDAPERTYQAGESWTEQPGDHHQVSQMPVLRLRQSCLPYSWSTQAIARS